MNPRREILFVTAGEDELNKLVAGRIPDRAIHWPSSYSAVRPRKDEIGVLLEQAGSMFRPIAFVADDDSDQRFFGRFAQLRSDFSPISTWAHVVPTRIFELLDFEVREPSLGGFETSWSALAVAEAQLLSGTDLSNIKIAACLATQSFAAARTLSLWPSYSLDDVGSAYDDVRRLLRSHSAQSRPLSSALEPIWEILAELCGVSSRKSARQFVEIISALQRLNDEGVSGSKPDIEYCLSPLVLVAPLAHEVQLIDVKTPEHRLKIFDDIVAELNRAELKINSREYIALTFLAGFVATIAAGGSPSLALAESQAKDHPGILAWAYVAGSLGERVSWTSSFDGLGRLVARELLRPFRLNEPPTADFCYRELKTLADPGLSDPLVHLRIKQARTVEVALFPGVNVVFSIAEAGRADRAARSVESGDRLKSPARADESLLQVLAEALAPYLRDRLARPANSAARPSRAPRRKRDSDGPDGNLPFVTPKRP